MMRVLILFLALALPLRAEEFPAAYAVTGVASNDVLNVRARPDAGSAIIGSLAPDATGVEVLAVTGNWALVNSGEGAGYASLRYLEREPGPGWSALQSPLTCLGTEPFWSLEIDPEAGTTRYLTPEDQSPPAEPITALWPAEPWARSAAVGLSDGVAVLTGAECSDGMSDRAFGIAVDLFRSGPEGASRASGCCRLALP
jgi:uncharacterized membrane protein